MPQSKLLRRAPGALVLWAMLTGSGRAEAFCRTTTVPIAADFDPTLGACWSEGIPLWWRTACVSYDLQKDASRRISYDQASLGMATAFRQWTGASCATSDGTLAQPSIDVRDLGPVDCDLVQYNSDGPNQHVIVFRDDYWPYNDINNTLALTTVTFDPDTGEIYDADMEINTAQQVLTAGDVVPAGGYDFESIVTHESGHFLGMAHSGDYHATMYAHYTPGSEMMRSLTQDDTGGICTIYPPNGSRTVAMSVSEDASIEEGTCDPTPRHGFSSECASPAKRSCSVGAALGAPAEREIAFAPLVLILGMAGVRRSRKSRS